MSDMTKDEVLKMINGEGCGEECELDGECDNSHDYSFDDFLMVNTVSLDTENVSDVTIDRELFKKGVDSVSELCGAISALVNVGIHPNKAMDFLVEKEAAFKAMEHNIEITKIQANANIKCSENESVLMQRGSI